MGVIGSVAGNVSSVVAPAGSVVNIPILMHEIKGATRSRSRIFEYALGDNTGGTALYSLKRNRPSNLESVSIPFLGEDPSDTMNSRLTITYPFVYQFSQLDMFRGVRIFQKPAGSVQFLFPRGFVLEQQTALQAYASSSVAGNVIPGMNVYAIIEE